MARKSNGPWFWESNGGWFVHHEGKRVNLHVKGKSNEAEAIKAWHRLMAGIDTVKSDTPLTPPKPVTVKEVINAYLADAEGRMKNTSYANLRGLLTSFRDAHGERPADGLPPSTVTIFVNRPGWSSSHRHNHIGAISTAFRWAYRVGYLATDPLKELKRPAKASRGTKSLITDAVHEKLLSVASPEFGKLLILLRETGARPSELASMTAINVDVPNAVAILTEHKTAHTGKPRLVFLTPKAVDVLKLLMVERPTGCLLVNVRGNPWTKDAIGLAMRRTAKRIGVKAMAYGYRHTFATDALSNGVPDATVAALLGHSDTNMVHQHYSHLTSRTATLKAALDKVRG